MEASSDADLVQAALNGDKESFGTLIQRHWQTAVCLATRVLGTPDIARDAVQEAAIAAMTGLDRLSLPDRFGAWFCGITLNVSRSWLRQRRAELTGHPIDQPSSAADPAEIAELEDLAARVRDAIGLLAGGQAAAVRLFYLQGLSHREVAAELGISAAAVKARLHQARTALAPRLAQVMELQPASKSRNSGRKAKIMNNTVEQRWVPSSVTEIRLAQGEDGEDHHIMVLSESGGDRKLPIWIGPAEATALALSLESTETPRPITYQLAAGLVTAAGASIKEIRITRLQPPVFYAIVIVDGAEGQREVDARPSDAVNLALTANAPILIDGELFNTDYPAEHTGKFAASSVVTADLAAQAIRKFTQIAGELEGKNH
ncbi:MAG TPA: bifunctional nuclease domain-containing protein [Streptosporangiaceae bacterium]|nr:bifunctional nuclease domain-containing protein [Streptosporangiaceae bacterium]